MTDARDLYRQYLCRYLKYILSADEYEKELEEHTPRILPAAEAELGEARRSVFPESKYLYLLSDTRIECLEQRDMPEIVKILTKAKIRYTMINLIKILPRII